MEQVVAAIVGPEGYILEIPEARPGSPIWMVEASSYFEANPDGWSRYFVWLEPVGGSGAVYPMTAVATGDGFLIGGGDVNTGRSGIWRAALPTEKDAIIAVPIEYEVPQESQASGNQLEVRHLARSVDRWFAVVAARGGSTEVWSATDPSSWDFEELMGVHPTSNRYASARSLTGDTQSEFLGPAPQTLLVTDGGFPSDIWALSNDVTKLSDRDVLAYQWTVFPLFVGWADDVLHARVVEHSPRWSQTDPDVVRTRLFALEGGSWNEVGATAWDRMSRIQSVVGLGSEVAAIGTAVDPFGSTVNEVFDISGSELGEPTRLETEQPHTEMFQAAATPSAAVTVGTVRSTSGDRIVTWRSEDLEHWELITLKETRRSYVEGVCSGIGRVWIVGHKEHEPVAGVWMVGSEAVEPDSARSWSSTDGATWSMAVPATVGDEPVTALTECAGDEDRVVAAVAGEPWLISSSDGQSWKSIRPPSGLLATDRIVDVAVDGERIGVIIERHLDYFQPRFVAGLWDGASWYQVDPEPGALYGTIALHAGAVYLGGSSPQGSTIWSSISD